VRALLKFIIGCGVFAAAAGWYYAAASPERYCDRAWHCLRTANPEKLEYELLAFDRRPEFESRSCLLRAWLHLQLREGDEYQRVRAALLELQYAMQDERIQPLAISLVGRSLYEVGQFSAAIELLDQAAKLDPDEPEAHRCLGVVFYDLGLNSAALRELDRLAELEPTNSRPHRVMGLIYREQGDTSDAVAAYRESLARDPNSSDADDIRVELGRCLFALRQYDEAIAAVSDCGKITDAMVLRAEAFYGKGQVKEAEQWVSQALDRDPQDPYALAFKATLARVDGDMRRAADLLAKAVRRLPNDYTLRFRLAQAYRRLGEEQLAKEQEDGMEELRELREELRELIEKAATDVTDVSLRYRIAVIAERLGKSELAGHWLKAARMIESGMTSTSARETSGP
jgi:tetratricopeptide (TPR) repeat protein